MTKVTQAQEDYPERVVWMMFALEHLEPMAHQGPMAHQEHQGPMEHREPMEHQEHLDLKVTPEHPEHPELKVTLEQLVHTESQNLNHLFQAATPVQQGMQLKV